jgi:hypothetical protein
MPKPRTAPNDIGFCPVHGQTELRWHKDSKRPHKGVWTCNTCHSAIELARHHGRPRPYETSRVQVCGHTIHHLGENFVCVRPQGHPLDVHRSADKVEWRVRLRLKRSA